MAEWEWSGNQVQAFVDAHAMAAGFDLLNDTEGVSRITPGAREVLDREARAFASQYGDEMQPWLNPAQAGQDLWLSRQGHGAGFFSRYLPNDPAEIFNPAVLGKRRDAATVAEFDAAMQVLQGKAQALGESSLYEGQDGRLYTY